MKRVSRKPKSKTFCFETLSFLLHPLFSLSRLLTLIGYEYLTLEFNPPSDGDAPRLREAASARALDVQVLAVALAYYRGKTYTVDPPVAAEAFFHRGSPGADSYIPVKFLDYRRLGVKIGFFSLIANQRPDSAGQGLKALSAYFEAGINPEAATAEALHAYLRLRLHIPAAAVFCRSNREAFAGFQRRAEAAHAGRRDSDNVSQSPNDAEFAVYPLVFEHGVQVEAVMPDICSIDTQRPGVDCAVAAS